MNTNEDFIHCLPFMDTLCQFIIKGKAMKASEEFDELVSIIGKFLEITDGFFKPNDAVYHIALYSEDVSVYSLLTYYDSNSTIKPSMELIRRIKSFDGFTFEDFVNDAKCGQTTRGVRGLPGIHLSGETKFILNSSGQEIDQYIGVNSNLYREVQDNKANEKPPRQNPLEFDIEQFLSKDSPDGIDTPAVESTDPAYYQIRLDLYTDIWFTDSDVGRKNLDRLKKVIKDIYESYPVVYTLYGSEIGGVDWIKSIIPNIDIL